MSSEDLIRRGDVERGICTLYLTTTDEIREERKHRLFKPRTYFDEGKAFREAIDRLPVAKQGYTEFRVNDSDAETFCAILIRGGYGARIIRHAGYKAYIEVQYK